ncbi:MFS transporter [Candidatus Bathyarchaeota archaeon]|nr:MFS transporter [Candidatus Bathyarchaeota archaeon]
MKRFWSICVTHMFIEIYLLTQVALIPVFIQEFNLSLIEASLVASIPSMVQLFMTILSGLLAERFDTGRILSLSMLIEGGAALFLSQTKSFYMLILGVSLLKASSAIYHISGLSQISRDEKIEAMSRSMGFHNTLGCLGSALGVLSLSFFLTAAGWRWVYVFWAFPIFVWAIVISRFLVPIRGLPGEFKVERPAWPAQIRGLMSAGFMTFLVAVGLREFGTTGASTFMTTYLVGVKGLTETMASLIFGLGPLTGVVGSLLGGYLGERLGAKRALGLAILGCAIILPTLTLPIRIYLIAIAYLIYSTLSQSTYVPMNTLVTNLTPAKGRGYGFSAYFFTENIVMSFAPTAMASVMSLYGLPYFIQFSTGFMLAGLLALQPLKVLRSSRT